MRNLTSLGQTAFTVHSAKTALPFPPLSGVSVVDWNHANGSVPEADLEFSAAGAVDLTVATLYGGVGSALVVADDTFTVDHTTEIVTATSHGLQTGDGPVQLTNSGGALPAGLSAATDYWIIKIDANTFYFAASLVDALAGTAVAMTGNGTGTHTLSDTASTERLYWYSYGLLGDAGDGAISLSDTKGFVQRIKHRPRTEAYAVGATLSSAVAVSVRLYPIELK